MSAEKSQPIFNLNFSQFFTGKYGWIKATIMIVLILVAAGWAAERGVNVSVNLALEARVSAIENTLNVPVNSSLSAFRKGDSYVVSLVDSYACLQNGSNGGLREYSLSHSAIIQDALNNASISGGSVYVAEGPYSASVTLKNNTRLIIDQGATGITVAGVDVGANSILDDFNTGVFKYYSSGSIKTVFDYASGNLLTASANLTTLYVGAIDPLGTSYVSIYKLVVENGTGYPGSPQVGQLFYRTDLHTLSYWNSTDWVGCGGGGGGPDDDSIYLLSASATNFLFQNGTRALTGDWNAGAYGIYGFTWVNSTSLSATNYYLGNSQLGFIQHESFLIDALGGYTRAWYGANSTFAFQNTDATKTFQWAEGNSTNGGKITVSPGSYNVSTITVSHRAIWFCGQSEANAPVGGFNGEGTVLNLANGTNSNMFNVSAPSAAFFEISNMKLNGNAQNNTANGNGIWINDTCTDGYIHDLWIDDFSNNGIRIEPSGEIWGIRIINCDIEHNLWHGIDLEGTAISRSILIQGNYIHSNSLNGIYEGVQYVNSLTVSLNTIRYNNNNGIYLKYAHNFLLEENQIHDNKAGYSGIKLEGSSANHCENGTIIGNDINNIALGGSNGQDYGILFLNAYVDYITVGPNNLRGNRVSAISISYTYNYHGNIQNNMGYNPIGYIASPINSTSYDIVNSGANSTWTNNTVYTNTQSPKNLYVNGGTILAISVDSQVLFTATSVMVHLEVGDTFNATWSVAPTIVAIGE